MRLTFGRFTPRLAGSAWLALVLWLLFFPLPAGAQTTQERVFRLEASRFAYTPAVLAVQPGDRVMIELVSTDVVHGLAIDGYDLQISAEPGQPASLSFLADRPGVFRLRCTQTCGAMHPFMLGKFRVGDSYLLWRGSGLAVLLAAAAALEKAGMRSPTELFPAKPKGNNVTEAQRNLLDGAVSHKHHIDRSVLAAGKRFDLARLAWLSPLLRSRWPLFLARALTLAGFLFTITVGLFGSPVGSHNFAIIFVWIAWWSALKLAFIPLGGRSWCSVCPLPMPGEWLQQGGLVARAQKRLGLGLRWPKRLRGYWVQAALFLLIGLFSAVTLTNPRVTAWVLIGLILLAFILSLVFERRAFCSYICPIGGFSGIYARTAPLEVHVIDTPVCAAHKEKTCYQACPWGLYPLALRDSSQCGLCMECLRVCPHENIALNLRPFGSNLRASPRSGRLDEAFLALVMLGSALAFTAVFSGPWGGLKNAAFEIGSRPYLAYAAGFLLLNLALLPAAFAGAAWLSARLSREKFHLRKAIALQAQALLPLGLFSWIAFTISFALPKLSYVLKAISDPLGLGWRLLSDVETVVNADRLGLAPGLQVGALLAGLYWSVRVAVQPSGTGVSFSTAHSRLQALPVIAFNLIYTLLLMGLLVG